MYRLPLRIGLIVLGISLMGNPVYLPVETDETDSTYLHTVDEVDPATPEYVESISYDDLSPDAQTVFDQARRSETGYSVDDPDERLDGFAYPTDPGLGNGITIVSHEGTNHEFRTRTIEREGRLMLLQRGLIQPGLFLAGLFTVMAGLILTGGSALGQGRSAR